jgi:hypothetical protein
MSFTVDAIDSYYHPKIGFGIDQKKAAIELRRLADEIEKPIPEMGGEYICIQEAITLETVNIDDYAMTTLVLKFATKKSDGGIRPT